MDSVPLVDEMRYYISQLHGDGELSGTSPSFCTMPSQNFILQAMNKGKTKSQGGQTFSSSSKKTIDHRGCGKGVVSPVSEVFA